MSRTAGWLVFSFALLFFAAFFLWPILQILQGGFVDADGRFTLAFLREILTDPIYLEGLRNSLLVGVGATTVALTIALPLAWISDRYKFPGKQVWSALVLTPLILPPFVGAIGVKAILGQNGALNALLHQLGILDEGALIDWFGISQFAGVVLMIGFNLYPILYLNLVAALSNVDPSMEEAAENLGCTGFRKFFKITLPLIQPGMFAGCTIVFIWSFTELGVPLIFDYSRVASVQIFHGIKDIGGNPFPYALVALILGVTVCIYAIGKGLFGRQSYAMMAKAAAQGGVKEARGLKGWVFCGIFAAVTLLAVSPHIGVLFVAFSNDWYGTLIPREFTLSNFELALGHDLTVPAIRNSLIFAGLSTLVDIVLGVAIAWVVVRGRIPGWARQSLDTLAMLPLAVPGLVVAFGYLAMSQEGKLFGFLNPTENPTVLLVIAYAVRRLPYVVRSAAAGFQQTSETLEEAAQNLGCPPFKTLLRITIPLITANLIAGALLAFAFAMLEVSDSLLLAQKQEFYPITKAIFELFQLLGDGQFIASALGVWAMTFLALTISGLSILLGKRLGALFRV
jgi:iron(III) transport system permease protein